MPEPPTTPPDRGALPTEHRNPRTMDLDTLSVEDCVKRINREDAGVPEAVGRAAPAISDLIRRAERGMTAGGRLIYIGAGTSGRLGVLDASECPPTFQTDPELVVGIIAGGDAALRRSSESKEDVPDGARAELEALRLTPNDTLLGIAAGGTTPYVLGALRLAKEAGATTGLLCCVPVEPPPACDVLICVETGPEVITGSTRMKAGTATKLVLNTISTTLMVRTGRVHENLMVDLRATNDKLKDRALRIVGELTGLDRGACHDLLERAGWGVKVAALMHARGVTRDQAERALERAGGRLRDALEGRRSSRT
ncbi:MAG: N-acetylmuramic acid 6-phosphate etherase [Phycisphaerales bacterium JB059]